MCRNPLIWLKAGLSLKALKLASSEILRQATLSTDSESFIDVQLELDRFQNKFEYVHFTVTTLYLCHAHCGLSSNMISIERMRSIGTTS